VGVNLASRLASHAQQGGVVELLALEERLEVLLLAVVARDLRDLVQHGIHASALEDALDPGVRVVARAAEDLQKCASHPLPRLGVEGVLLAVQPVLALECPTAPGLDLELAPRAAFLRLDPEVAVPPDARDVA